MRTKSRIIESLIAITIIAFIFMITTGYFISSFMRCKQTLDAIQNEYDKIVDELDSARNELTTTQENYQIEIEKSTKLNEELNNTIEDLNNVNLELAAANSTISDLKSEEYRLVYMGDFKITYYCDERRAHICGGNGVTASGKPTEVGVTAAADWGVLPKGSKVYIQNVGWREIQDIGGGVNGQHVDVLVNTHSEALSLGTSSEGVWLLIQK